MSEPKTHGDELESILGDAVTSELLSSVSNIEVSDDQEMLSVGKLDEASKNFSSDEEFDDGFDDDESEDSRGGKGKDDDDEDFDEDDEEDFDEEKEDEAPEGSSGLKSKNTMILVWGVCLAVFIVFFFSTRGSSEEKEESMVEDSRGVESSVSDYSVFYAESLEVGQTMYKDYMVISKYISTEGSNLVLKFTGNLESYGQTVEVAVDLDTYNSYPSGSRVSVVFYKTLVDEVEKIVIIQVQPVR